MDPSAVETNIDVNDLVNLVTKNGRTSDLSSIIDHWTRYVNMGNKGQTLILLLYSEGDRLTDRLADRQSGDTSIARKKSLENYLLAFERHPLERHIFAFDEILDEESLVRAVGSAAGIFVEVSNRMADDIFFEKMQDVIYNLNSYNAKAGTKSPEWPTLEEIIYMREDLFLDFLKSKSVVYPANEVVTPIEHFDFLYQDRVNTYLWLRNTQQDSSTGYHPPVQ